PAYRFRQVLDYLRDPGAASFDDITVLPKNLRKQFAEAFLPSALRVKNTFPDPEGHTDKFLFESIHGGLIEAVGIHAPDRLTVCVSSQIGCAMRCAFCATGRGGLERNLNAAEIFEQVQWIQRLLKKRVTNLVFMGMGEPLHNLDNVLKALQYVRDPQGLAMGARKVTVSTVGVVPGMLKLAEAAAKVYMAVSLHAPDDETRSRLVPVNDRYPIAEVMDAVKVHHRTTNLPTLYEYVLLKGVNDSPVQARLLAGLVRHLPCKVNLIPWNPVEGMPFERPSMAEQRAFMDVLKQANVPVTIRMSKGRPVDAACGQLRRRAEDGSEIVKFSV
ncbi:MAG TPA: 23S rRNA (adenine(2503)-C(2))-methyltransferase RlmN, partial [Planctomycetota bacterium]|nr:23S rRNA (adenine(2503)-C(2))-methyltransferase RlmN [Planctomycetota bacterium]